LKDTVESFLQTAREKL